MKIPPTVTISYYHSDGSIVNRIFVVPDPATLALIESMLGTPIMDGLTTEDQLMARRQELGEIGTFIVHDNGDPHDSQH